MSDKNKRYLELVEMQSKCELLSVRDSIELTELIKVGQSMEVAHHLMTILCKVSEPRHETVEECLKSLSKELYQNAPSCRYTREEVINYVRDHFIFHHGKPEE
jgi:hypothetical protein